MGATLEPSERVELVIVGRYNGASAALALTGSRLLLTNDRAWRPDVESFELSAGLTVQGWSDGRNASLALARDGRPLATIEQISDAQAAQQMAGAIRARAAD